MDDDIDAVLSDRLRASLSWPMRVLLNPREQEDFAGRTAECRSPTSAYVGQRHTTARSQRDCGRLAGDSRCSRTGTMGVAMTSSFGPSDMQHVLRLRFGARHARVNPGDADLGVLAARPSCIAPS